MMKNETNETMNIRGWLIVGVSFLTLMILFATVISCMGVYIKPVSEEFGLDRTTFSLTTTICSLAMLLSAVVAGKMMHRFGVKKLMAIGAVCGGGSMFIYALAPSIAWFYVAAAIAGTTISFTCNIPVAILIRNWFDDHKVGLAMGIALVGSGVGVMVLNPLYTWIITESGWRYSFGLAGAIILLIIFPLILLVVKDERGASAKTEDAKHTEKGAEGVTLSEALRVPATWIVFLAYVISAVVNMAFVNHGVAYFTDSGIEPQKAAMIISSGAFVLIAGKVIMGSLDGRIGTRKTTALCALLISFALIAFWMVGVTGSVIVIALYAVLYGFGAAVSTVSMPMVVSKMFGNRDYGALMGFFCMTPGIGGMLQVVISMVYDRIGSYTPAWIVISILSLCTVLMYAVYIHPVTAKHNKKNERCVAELQTE